MTPETLNAVVVVLLAAAAVMALYGAVLMGYRVVKFGPADKVVLRSYWMPPGLFLFAAVMMRLIVEIMAQS